jgi:hypothetical protein
VGELISVLRCKLINVKRVNKRESLIHRNCIETGEVNCNKEGDCKRDGNIIIPGCAWSFKYSFSGSLLIENAPYVVEIACKNDLILDPQI